MTHKSAYDSPSCVRLRILRLRLLIRTPVGESLPLDGLESVTGAFGVVDPESYAVVVAEIKFREIAMQVLALAVLIRAGHAALEHGKHTFDSVRMRIAAHVLAFAVIYRLMIRKLLADLAVDTRAIGHKHSLRGDILLERALDPREQLARDVRGADFAAALNEREYRFLVPVPRKLGAPRLTPDVGFVSLNCSPTGAHESTGNVVHRVTNAVCHEPRRLIGHAKRAMELVAADA